MIVLFIDLHFDVNYLTLQSKYTQLCKFEYTWLIYFWNYTSFEKWPDININTKMLYFIKHTLKMYVELSGQHT